MPNDIHFLGSTESLFHELPQTDGNSLYHRVSSLCTQPKSAMSFNAVPTSIPSQHYIIASEDVSVDQATPLGAVKHNGKVFKGYWNESVVAVKFLKSDIPGEVRNLFFVVVYTAV